jgi:hypothetical protein
VQGMPAITRAKLLDFAARGFLLFVAGTRVVALFALGASQSYDISWHGIVLLKDLNGMRQDYSRPSPLFINVTR